MHSEDSTLSTFGDRQDDDSQFNVLRICAALGKVSSVLAKASRPTVAPIYQEPTPGLQQFWPIITYRIEPALKTLTGN
jgi:hypothetical protein